MTVYISQNKKFDKTDNDNPVAHRVSRSHPGQVAENKCKRSYYSDEVDVGAVPVKASAIVGNRGFLEINRKHQAKSEYQMEDCDEYKYCF